MAPLVLLRRRLPSLLRAGRPRSTGARSFSAQQGQTSALPNSFWIGVSTVTCVLCYANWTGGFSLIRGWLSGKKEAVDAKVTHVVYLDVAVGKEPSRRVAIGLFGDVVPRTAKNFRLLCTGATAHPTTGRPLTYARSPMHRIIPGFMCQGGDITKGDGTGGRSIYHTATEPNFADENFELLHGGLGTLSMANAGPNTNSSQFFICTGPTPHLDGKHVVFGRVLGKPSMRVVREMEAQGSGTGRVINTVVVTGCGELVVDEANAAAAEAGKPAEGQGQQGAAEGESKEPVAPLLGMVELFAAGALVEAAPAPSFKCHAAMANVDVMCKMYTLGQHCADKGCVEAIDAVGALMAECGGGSVEKDQLGREIRKLGYAHPNFAAMEGPVKDAQAKCRKQ